MASAKPATAIENDTLSHNLLGQRLGRKGRDTRERILAATNRLLEGPADTAISLSAVAREASLGMTTLYLYFTDLTELLIAVLGEIMPSSEESYVAHLRERWPDADLGEHCVRFVAAYHAFWQQHTRILHLRNSFADANDQRMRAHRIEISQPLMQLIARQMDADTTIPGSDDACMATVLHTGIERLVTVTTDVNFSSLAKEGQDLSAHIRNLMRAEARLLEMGIRDARARNTRA